MTDIATGRVISGEREVSRETIMERAGRVASGFGALGVTAGDAIALVLRNDFPFFEASYAAQRLGAYCVPVNWHGKTPEIAYVLRDCGAKAILAHADLLPQVAPAVPEGVPLLVVPAPPEIAAAYGIPSGQCGVPAGARAWDEWLAGLTPMPEGASAAFSSMIYTSGTTGHPKGVRRLNLGLEFAETVARVSREVLGFVPGRPIRTVITGPVYHSVPNFYGLRAVREGALVILQPRFDAEGLLQLIERYRITHLHTVPTMFVRLLRLPEAVRRNYDLSSLEWVAHGAAPCPTYVKRAMIDWWGPIIAEYYGGTESGFVTFHTAEEALRKPGTVGRPLSDATIRVYDDDGRELPPGEIGEIYVRLQGAGDFTYQGMPDKRREIERDGLISIGDVGYLDEDGYLFLCDRRHDMVISGGVNIYPAEIEAALLAVPGVRDCAVFGVPDEEFGESLCAHIEAEPGVVPNETAIRALLRDRLADFKVPRVIRFDTNLPREDSGKIMKRKLRDPYWEATGRRI
ncbi:MAG: AMP-binding protein [Acetobacteraceae bacterium]|nr:AMP-binding protein [Acetobacteraceae bacterium]